MAVRGETLIVTGYRPLLKALQHADRDTRLYMREAFKEVGEVVRVDAQRRFERFSPVSAAGYRVRVRQRGVAVEQSLRKTTGRRPDWGARQMTDALLPALESKQGQVERGFEDAIDKVADHFNHTEG
jgi:hypothetical protein